MFVIACHSCAARLKVTQLSLVGQLVACPKCGTMIEVVAPEGWDLSAPEAPSDDSSSRSGDSESLGSQFDDIDQLLHQPNGDSTQSAAAEKNDTQSEPIRKVVSPTTKWKVPQKGSQEFTDTLGDDQPLLPTDQWTSDQTRQRKKWLGLAAGATVLLLLLIVVVVSVRNARQVSRNRSQLNKPVDPTTEDSPLSPSEVKGADSPSEGSEDDDTPIEPWPPSNPPKDGQGPLPQTPTDPVDPPGNPDVFPATAIPENPPPVLPSNNPLKPPTGPIQGAEESPIHGGGSEALQDNLAAAGLSPASELAPLQSQLGKLSDLLVRSGSSLSEFQDIAGVEQSSRVGISRYFIEQPSALNIDVSRQLGLPCGGMQYDQCHLVSVLRDFSVITGIPVTVDTQAVVAAGLTINPQVNFTASKISFGEALTALLKPQGLSWSTEGNQLLVRPAVLSEMVSRRYSLEFTQLLAGSNPDFKDGQDENEIDPLGATLVAAIQSLIFPESWVAEENPATVSLDGHELTVHNTPAAQNQISTFLENLNTLATQTESPASQSGLELLPSRWMRVKKNLLLPTGLKFGTEASLPQFLERIHKNTGLTILVEWNRLAEQGWTPATRVPGHMTEPTVEQWLTELSSAMNLTFIAIDESTVLLTTLKSASQKKDLEIYPLAKVVSGSLNEEQILHLIAQIVGPQLQSPGIRYVSNQHCQCLFLLAPQSVQRLVSTSLSRLESIAEPH